MSEITHRPFPLLESNLLVLVDPIFFLHHTNVDRIWWQWQTLNDTRKIEFGGNKNQGDTTTKATLNDTIQMLGIVEDSTVESCMWVQSGPMCYTY